MLTALAFIPIELRAGERLRRLRIGNFRAQLGRAKRCKAAEFVPPALRDLRPGLVVVIREITERRRRRPFLTHEQHWRERQQQQQRRSSTISGRRDDVAEAFAERAVTGLVVIRDAVNETEGVERRWIAAARAIAGELRLAGIEPA